MKIVSAIITPELRELFEKAFATKDPYQKISSLNSVDRQHRKTSAYEEIARIINDISFNSTIRAINKEKFRFERVPDHIIEEIDFNIDATMSSVSADDLKRLLPSIMNSYKTMFVVNLSASGKAAAEGTVERAGDGWNYCVRGKLRDLGMYYAVILFEEEDISFIMKDLPEGIGRSSSGTKIVTGPTNASITKSAPISNEDFKNRNMELALMLKEKESAVDQKLKKHEDSRQSLAMLVSIKCNPSLDANQERLVAKGITKLLNIIIPSDEMDDE